MRSLIQKLFGKKTYDVKEELLKAFLSGKLSIALPIDVEAIAILSMFEYCVMKPSEKDERDLVAYTNKIIETLAGLPETIECRFNIGSKFEYSTTINKTDVLRSLIRILEISRNSYLAYINLLWEVIEENFNNFELKLLRLPLVSKDKLKVSLPGIILGEKIQVSIMEMISEQVYTIGTTKDFILGYMLGFTKAFLEAVCSLSPKLFEIKVKEVRDALRVHAVKIYGPNEKVDSFLKQYDEVVSSIRERCFTTSSKIIDILDGLIAKAKQYL